VSPASFVADHPVICAQQAIDAIIGTELVSFGVYATSPQPRINVLADIRAIAGRALAYATPDEFDQNVPADLLQELRQPAGDATVNPHPSRNRSKPGLAAPARAASTAVGVVAAVQVLGAASVDEGGKAIRWLVSDPRTRGLNVGSSNIGWGKRTTAVLEGVQLSGLAPHMNPATTFDSRQYRQCHAARPARHPGGFEILLGVCPRHCGRRGLFLWLSMAAINAISDLLSQLPCS
jgi:hypothetical protein